MDRNTQFRLVIASFGLMGMQSFLSWGSAYTIMSHANLFSSLTAILVVLYRIISCKKLTLTEMFATALAFVGCTFITFDPSAEKTNEKFDCIPYGNFLSFISSLFATAYII